MLTDVTRFHTLVLLHNSENAGNFLGMFKFPKESFKNSEETQKITRDLTLESPLITIIHK